MREVLKIENLKKYYGVNSNTTVKEDDLADFRRENLGFIFQDFNLLDTLTIAENIALLLIINKDNINEVDNKVKSIASKLGISDILEKFPYEVSGGQKQRCACARALINKPKLILADEPTGALDSKSSRMLLETMEEMNEKLKATILMVTHDSFSASFCGRVLFLKERSIKDYIIYLITITITISFSLIFALNLISSSEAVVELSKGLDTFAYALYFICESRREGQF